MLGRGIKLATFGRKSDHQRTLDSRRLETNRYIYSGIGWNKKILTGTFNQIFLNRYEPLFERIGKNLCPDDIMKHLSQIVDLCIKRNYIKVNKLKFHLDEFYFWMRCVAKLINQRPVLMKLRLRKNNIIADKKRRKFFSEVYLSRGVDRALVCLIR